MDGLNKVQLIGNLGADPELRTTPGGQAVLNIRLACTTSYLDRNNERQERTEWASCTVWGKRGEGLAKILNKGDRIYVEGELRTETYEKDGEKRYATKVNVSNVVLCGGRRSDDGDRQSSGGSQRNGNGGQRSGAQQGAFQPRGDTGGQRSNGNGGGRPAPKADDFGYGGGFDDEIPF